jgi:hypothetical protein
VTDSIQNQRDGSPKFSGIGWPPGGSVPAGFTSKLRSDELAAWMTLEEFMNLKLIYQNRRAAQSKF